MKSVLDRKSPRIEKSFQSAADNKPLTDTLFRSKPASYALLQAQANKLPLADESVQCVVTSPPYWGLRKYAGEQDLIWPGREGLRCDEYGHEWVDERRSGISGGQNQNSKADNKDGATNRPVDPSTHSTCLRCGAWRGAYGLEPTIELYVGHTVEILREIRRVLKPDGVCFWNVGDSYSGGAESNCKPKDLCLIPFRVALAAQADGWWVRSVIIWAKPNPMPESVKDRPTDAYEHILMLTKSAKYFWDRGAVSEPKAESTVRDSRHNEDGKRRDRGYVGAPSMGGTNLGGPDGRRNMRNVWTFPTQPYKGAHFATFPEELPRRCIKAASKPGDVILDPFCGSGTTGKVALELGRQFIGVDLAYHDLAKRRIESVQGSSILRADLSLCLQN